MSSTLLDPSIRQASSSSVLSERFSSQALDRSRKPRRIYRYLEGFISEQERIEREQAVEAASARAETEVQDGEAGGKKKRIKAARACIFCKRSHMCCEVQRPCSRCIARGIGDRCCDVEPDGTVSNGGDGAGAEVGGNSSAHEVEARHGSDSLVGSMSRVGQVSPPSSGPSTELTGPEASNKTLDAMLAFLGSMDAATAAWGPVPAQFDGSSAQPAFGDVAWTPLNSVHDDDGVPMTMPSVSSAPSAPSPAVLALRKGGAAQPNRPNVNVDNLLTESNKPFISGNLAEYRDRHLTRRRPWQHIMSDSFSASASLEESIVRPYQYAYGYTRIERWIRSPLSGWSQDSADRAQAVLDMIRPLFRNRWASLSDLHLVQHEERYLSIVDHYRKFVCEAVPVPMVIIRRTCEIVCANQAFSELCNIDPIAFESGRLCLYQLLDQTFMVDIFETLANVFVRHAHTPVRLNGDICFSCISKPPSSSDPDNATDTQLRQIRTPVALSMDPIMDEHGLPLCLVCTLTPLGNRAPTVYQ